jgi:RimJ/RimL family protein N-acetyltransferase
VTVIETERLILRLPRPEDAPALAEAISDPEVMRYIGDGSTGDVEQARATIARFLNGWSAGGPSQFLVERRADGRVLGRTGFLVWHREEWRPGTRAEFGDDAEVELGWLFAREHWGQGFATEAATAARDWAWRELGLPRLVSLILPGNERSARVAEKLGEVYERDVTTVFGQTTRVFSVER